MCRSKIQECMRCRCCFPQLRMFQADTPLDWYCRQGSDTPRGKARRTGCWIPCCKNILGLRCSFDRCLQTCCLSTWNMYQYYIECTFVRNPVHRHLNKSRRDRGCTDRWNSPPHVPNRYPAGMPDKPHWNWIRFCPTTFPPRNRGMTIIRALQHTCRWNTGGTPTTRRGSICLSRSSRTFDVSAIHFL